MIFNTYRRDPKTGETSIGSLATHPRGLAYEMGEKEFNAAIADICEHTKNCTRQNAIKILAAQLDSNVLGTIVSINGIAV